MCLGLSDQRPCCLDADFGAGKLRFGLTFLCVQLHHVHLHQHIACADHVTFGSGDFGDSAAGERRDIHLGRLDPAIGAGKTRRQTGGLQPVPGQPAKHGDNGQAAQNNGVSAGLCHDLPLIAVLMDASRMSRCGFRPTLPCCQRSMTG